MIFLIKEERTTYFMGVSTRSYVIGYYKCNDPQEVIDYCKRKTAELKDTYDDSRIEKRYVFKELNKLN